MAPICLAALRLEPSLRARVKHDMPNPTRQSPAHLLPRHRGNRPHVHLRRRQLRPGADRAPVVDTLRAPPRRPRRARERRRRPRLPGPLPGRLRRRQARSRGAAQHHPPQPRPGTQPRKTDGSLNRRGSCARRNHAAEFNLMLQGSCFPVVLRASADDDRVSRAIRPSRA